MENKILIILSIFCITYIIIVLSKFKLTFFDKIYSYIALITSVLVIFNIFFVKKEIFGYIPHFLHATLMIIAPFILKNKYLLIFHILNILFTLWTRYIFNKCILNSDKEYLSLPFNIDRMFIILAILSGLRIYGLV